VALKNLSVNIIYGQHDLVQRDDGGSQCIDPAETAQVRLLKHKLRQGFSFPTLGEGAGDCKNQSSHQ
jgi:hypothetical protein